MTAPTLTEFLLARIAEDEAAVHFEGAVAMTGVRWKRYPEDAYNEVQTVTLALCRRVLAECEAKRRIVAIDSLNSQHRDLILRALAAPYTSRPDYRAEWGV